MLGALFSVVIIGLPFLIIGFICYVLLYIFKLLFEVIVVWVFAIAAVIMAIVAKSKAKEIQANDKDGSLTAKLSLVKPMTNLAIVLAAIFAVVNIVMPIVSTIAVVVIYVVYMIFMVILSALFA